MPTGKTKPIKNARPSLKIISLVLLCLSAAGCAVLETAKRTAEAGVSAAGSQSASAAASEPAASGKTRAAAPPQARPAQPKPEEKPGLSPVDEAIASGDCAALASFADPAAAGVSLADKRKAAAALNRYIKPDPAPVRYRTGKIDPRIANIRKETLEGVFQDPAAHIEDLVKQLTQREPNHFMKAKILHDWIAYHIAYDTEDLFRNLNRPQDYASVLKRKTAVCAGYSQLFKKMADLAGVEARIISGHSKGFGYRGFLGGKTDHAWNAVKVSGKWHLVDVTWDAGHVDRKTFVRNYSTDYLFLDPRSFLYSHLPEHDAEQFWYPLVTAEQFVREPLIKGRFFSYGLKLKDDSLRYSNAADGAFSTTVISPSAGVVLTSALRDPSQNEIVGADFFTKRGGNYEFLFSPPDSGEYEGHIFARGKSEIIFPERVPIGEFEAAWLPLVEKSVAERKITEKEKEVFIGSFRKVPENGVYYFLEDPFDRARVAAVPKVLKSIGVSVTWLQSVLDFELKRNPGSTVPPSTYPHIFSSYADLSATELVGPLTGILKRGEKTHLVVRSRDLAKIAVIFDGTYHHFTKDAKGEFTLSAAVPESAEKIVVYGSRDGRSYSGIWRFAVD